MTTRSYAILGTGAIGGYYGGNLARVGHEVHFLCRTAEETAHVNANGVRVESKFGDFHLDNVNAYHDARDLPPCDVTVVALKTTHNHLLGELLPAPTRKGGAVLMLQNGLGAEQQAAAVVGHERVLGGLCFVCIHKLGHGHIQHQDYGLVTVGQHREDGQPAGLTEHVQHILDDFAATRIPFEAAEDIELARWRKLVWNVPYNGLCVTEQCTTDVLMYTPQHLAHVEALMREVQAGCEAATGRSIDEAHVQKMLDNTRKMTPYKPSMLLDYEAGRPLELDAMYGEPVRRAETAGCAVPKMRALWERLQAMS